MTGIRIDVVHDPRPIVVGSGIAGLTTALSLSGSVVVTAQRIGQGSSNLAQGGMAAAIGSDDDARRHAADTVTVSGAIGDRSMAETIAAEAPGRIDWLRHLGAEFDALPDGTLDLGREAGHSRRRIVHAGGDRTGAEIMRAMRDATVVRDDIDLVTDARLVDLVRSGDRVVGVLTAAVNGEMVVRIGGAVVLATGGIGGVYLRSTNPADVTGAGLAAAARQGATLADLEFVQFHPTALASIDHPAPLISEALRGEGAALIDERGDRFMIGVHPDAELAPRDVVARAMWLHHEAGHAVYLDATASIGADMPERFPTAFASAMDLGIDPRVEPMPVLPAEHFHMGGVATDENGRTSVDGLWAAGEVASTGLHGANRLASNSLLEAAVMGQRVTRSIEAAPTRIPVAATLRIPADAIARVTAGLDRNDATVRSLAWAHLGIVRSGEGIASAIASLEDIDGPMTGAMTVAHLIATSALARRESRGAHHRIDHPDADPTLARRSTTRPEPVRMTTLPPATALAS